MERRCSELDMVTRLVMVCFTKSCDQCKGDPRNAKMSMCEKSLLN